MPDALDVHRSPQEAHCSPGATPGTGPPSSEIAQLHKQPIPTARTVQHRSGGDSDGENHAAEINTVVRPCVGQKVPPTATRAASYQDPGCNKRPRYAAEDGPWRLCQAHKRAGHNTLENGAVFVATRDDVAFRQTPSSNAITHNAATATRSNRTSQVSSVLSEGRAPARQRYPGSGSDQEARGKTTTGNNRPGSSSAYVMLGVLGSALSATSKLPLDATESTRPVAVASGSKRRSRTPSRKLQEASGRVADESVQLMTKEKREEQKRMNRALKAQRKAAAAAGLKVGEVIEAFTVPLARDPFIMQGGFRGFVSNDDGSEVSNAFWRKLTPAEIREISEQGLAVEWGTSSLPCTKGTRGDTNGEVVMGTREERELFVSAADTDMFPERRRKVVESAGKSTPRPSSLIVDWTPYISHERCRTDICNRQGPGKALCAFESCSKKASFGVNGVVRYCKMHRIFGMQKILALP